MDQHNRRARTDLSVERSRFRSSAAGILLRSRDRDSDTPLDSLRCQVFRYQNGASGSDADAGACLHIIYLVYAAKIEWGPRVVHQTSAMGHKRKWRHARVMSVLPLKADIHQRKSLPRRNPTHIQA